MPYPGYVLPDSAPLSDLIPPAAIRSDAVPEPPTPQEPSAAACFSNAPSESNALPPTHVPSTVPVSLGPGAPTSAPASSSSAARVPVLEVLPGLSTQAGILLVSASGFKQSCLMVEMYHNDEDPEWELIDDAADSLEQADDDEPESLHHDSAVVPSCLIFPFSEQDYEVDPETFREIDRVAMQFEVDRLTAMQVLQVVEGPMPGHRNLTTNQAHEGQPIWLRRARLVARDTAFLDPGRTDLYSPATSLQSRAIPSLFITSYHRGWILVGFDVSDAYLTCPQGELTCTSVSIGELKVWFNLLRLIPGQRDGSQRWFQQFSDALKAGSGI